MTKPKSRKQITSTLVYICPSCMQDLIPELVIVNVSGENFIRTKHICKSKDNCNYEYEE